MRADVNTDAIAPIMNVVGREYRVGRVRSRPSTRLAEMPQRVRRKAAAEHAEVAGKSCAQTERAVPLRLVQSNPAFQLSTRGNQGPLEEQRLAERPVRDHTQGVSG